MQESNRLGELKISTILADAVGSQEKANQLLMEVQDAIVNKQIEGEDLKRVIFKLLCKYDVPDVEMCHILYRSQVITK